VVCTAQPGESSPEECNLLDDDCDGDTDEGEDAGPLQRECYSGEPQTRGVGVCRAGVQTCGNGGWSVPCDGEVLPSDEVCNGADDDCNDQTDEAGNCEVCGQECPVAELPEGVLLCVAKPADTAGCPNSFPDDRDVLYAGTARADFTCEECECWTEVTPRYQAAAAGMQQGSCDDLRDRDPWECEDECERQYCSMDMASRAHRATMRLHAAGNELDGECELEDEVAFRLCCTDTLPTRQQCAGPVCPTPRRFLGFVLMGEEGPVTELCGDLGGGAGTVFEDVEPQGFSCGECPCRADLVVRSCVNHWGSGIGDEGGDGDRDPPEPVALGRCDVQRPGGACETPCLTWERAGPNGQQVPVAFSVRHEVEVQGNGAVPDLGAGTCDPVNPMLACDLGGEIIR